MGDVGDYWREHREYLRSKGISRPRGRKPAAKLVDFSKEHAKAGFTRFTEWHWQIRVAGDLLDFWPSKDKWRWRNKNYTGNAKAVLEFVQQHSESIHD